MRKIVHSILVAAMMLMTMTPAHAGPWRRRHRAAACGAQAQCQPAAVQMVPVVGVVAATVQPGGDANSAGFLAWLNATRAAHGLHGVGYDAGMEAVCNENNRRQAASGLGHYFLGHARRQNSAMGAGFPGVEIMWLNSPGHASALFDPGITQVGIAWFGAWCTYSAR